MAGELLQQAEKLRQAALLLVSPGAVFALPQLGCALALAMGFLAWRHWRRRNRFSIRLLWRALARSRNLLFHPSTGADALYYLINTFAVSGLIGWGVVSTDLVVTYAVRGLNELLGHRPVLAAPEWGLRACITLIAFLAYEFGYYADHYLKHKIPFLWAFHRTHHSAEVLTPLTVFRVHPVDTLIFVDIAALCIGTSCGLFIWLTGHPVTPYALASANVISVLGFFLLAQLQHSQFWIPLRGLWGRLLLSPAHHQLHHSLDPAHHNCNLGSFIGVWDWLFGTLYLPPKSSPRLRFGVEQNAAAPHRLPALLLFPFTAAWRVLRRAGT